MLYYHGTTLDLAKQIQEQGLQPNKPWKFHLINDYQIEMPVASNAVYITPDKDSAKWFAEFRAKYDRSKKGTRVSSIMGQSIKNVDAPIKQSIPAIVTFNLPDGFPIQADPESSEYLHIGEIPPECIVKVEALRYNPKIADNYL